MPSIGPMELVVVLIIALLVLGPKRLPEAGRSLGQGIRGFKDSLSNADPRESGGGELSATVPPPVQESVREPSA